MFKNMFLGWKVGKLESRKVGKRGTRLRQTKLALTGKFKD